MRPTPRLRFRPISDVFGCVLHLEPFRVQLKTVRRARRPVASSAPSATIRGVIVELPLVTAAEIAAEYRPGGEATVKATLRRLRARDLISAGVAEYPRGVAGRVAGAWHVYSALNLDAVRAARAHDEPAAKTIAKRAAHIESRRATVEFVRRLAELGGSASLRRRFEWASSLTMSSGRRSWPSSPRPWPSATGWYTTRPACLGSR